MGIKLFSTREFSWCLPFFCSITASISTHNLSRGWFYKFQRFQLIQEALKLLTPSVFWLLARARYSKVLFCRVPENLTMGKLSTLSFFSHVATQRNLLNSSPLPFLCDDNLFAPHLLPLCASVIMPMSFLVICNFHRTMNKESSADNIRQQLLCVVILSSSILSC